MIYLNLRGSSVKGVFFIGLVSLPPTGNALSRKQRLAGWGLLIGILMTDTREADFAKADPYPFDENRGFGGGIQFRFEGRVFYSHYWGEHQKKGIVICPHCKNSIYIQCNGPGALCRQCDKAIVLVGSELFIEDFDGCRPQGPCNWPDRRAADCGLKGLWAGAGK